VLQPNTIVRARAGDEAAVELVAGHALRLSLRVAASITGSREMAEDIAQNTAIRALQSLTDVREVSRLDGWIMRAATTESLNHLRKAHRKREALHPDPQPALESEPADAAFYRIAANPELRAALGRLAARQRAALALRYVLDLSDAGIADALGCRIGTARALLSRGRSQLRNDPSLQALRPHLTPAPASCRAVPTPRKQ
jgi:RNA polymerase sigma factor (sigma-70 family)